MNADKTEKPLYRSLVFQVIVGILAGVALGYFYPDTAASMKPLADGFIKLIKMVIAPIIFCTVVTGIAGMNNMGQAGRVGLKAVVYFEVMTTFALVIGLVIVNLYQPGANMHVDPKSLDTASIASYTSQSDAPKNFTEFVMHVIPSTMVDAFAKGEMLQVLLVSLLFACAMVSLGGEKTDALYKLVQQFSTVMFKIVDFIVILSPLGAFGAMAFTVGKYGIVALGPMASLMLGFYVTCILFIGVVLGAMMRLCGLRMWPFLKYIREELLIVLGTSSSESVLARLIEKMTALGCSRAVVGMVIPTGYSFNLDGTSIYLTMAAIFIAQALGIEMTLMHELTLIGVLLLTSKGAAGVTGSGFVVLAGSLSAVGHIPIEGIALILGIDRFMSQARAFTNMIGNGVGTIVVAKWENALDMQQAKRALNLP